VTTQALDHYRHSLRCHQERRPDHHQTHRLRCQHPELQNLRHHRDTGSAVNCNVCKQHIPNTTHNNNDSKQDNVYSAIICGKNIAKVYSGHLNECGQRQLAGHIHKPTAGLIIESDCMLPEATHNPSSLVLLVSNKADNHILPSHIGWKAEWTYTLKQGCARVQSCASQWFY